MVGSLAAPVPEVVTVFVWVETLVPVLAAASSRSLARPAGSLTRSPRKCCLFGQFVGLKWIDDSSNPCVSLLRSNFPPPYPKYFQPI